MYQKWKHILSKLINFRRQVKKSKSVIQLLLFNENTDDDVKCKNIKQTEILVDLREAILQVFSKKMQFTVYYNHYICIYVCRLQDIFYK